ncbi:MAG TPA: AvaI/BsoBI family type II restriction endonuclease [Candidatus Hydrogenedentes bacterium]|nr:AvaI/BsoBI family type II restriction endonuclease [Candidatus Hydrogenedentota bacterium]
MSKAKPYKNHLKSGQDLVTTYEQVRAGFVALALERNRRATPYVEQARTLKQLASRTKHPAELLKLENILPALLAAAGISDKASRHMVKEDKENAIQELITKFLEPSGKNYVEELVFRFLLTKGDALGGSMRNVGGAMAQRRLLRAVLSALALSRISCHCLQMASGVWVAVCDKKNADIEIDARGLSWKSKRGHRTLMFNIKAPIVRSNIDLCLLNCSFEQVNKAWSNPELYIALAELKGGIDPAGADEHWKTARSAMSRIKAAFAGNQLSPCTFYIGAAIANKMSEEIWGQLEAGALDNAANLTNERQLISLCQWLISL